MNIVHKVYEQFFIDDRFKRYLESDNFDFVLINNNYMSISIDSNEKFFLNKYSFDMYSMGDSDEIYEYSNYSNDEDYIKDIIEFVYSEIKEWQD